ncbi:hypothetical protein ACN3ZE_001977 [Providencia rettgeri]
MKTGITSRSKTRYQKLTDQSFYHSLLNFIGYIAAGTALWVLMQWQFMFVFPNNADVLDEHLRFKDIWNVAMYVVPYCFWGMAIKNASILVITTLNICYSDFQLYILKKKLTK